MKRLIYILAVVLLVVMASGCTSDEWSSNKTYSGNGVTFTYPGTWSENATKTVTTPAGSNNIAAVGSSDEGFAIGSISASGLDTASIQSVLNQLVQEYQTQGYGSSKSITVDGSTATVITTTSKDSSGYYTTIAFWVKNNSLYYAAYVSSSNSTQNMERILGSLKTT
ncbi:hypothetical protein [Methanobacterium sp.]|uniref:hypothetical protein n=1 Tax=Methanobacterium sp. TaxID=2164 RepID=UPI002AB833E0|nr:hypothetical protein [Methanobacterium sp.]MDY9924226.1 hypothetical protein [Methanobacterium sp.]